MPFVSLCAMLDKITRAARRKQQAIEIEQSQAGLRKSIAETERLMVLSDEMLARHQREREADDNED